MSFLYWSMLWLTGKVDRSASQRRLGTELEGASAALWHIRSLRLVSGADQLLLSLKSIIDLETTGAEHEMQ
jgi:hypothetical protein